MNRNSILAGSLCLVSGPVDFEQDPAAAYTLENLKVELIEAQPSWVRYRISPAGG